MEALLNALVAAGATMETTYLGIIALLDRAESLANSSDYVSPTDALLIGEAKQKIIESFAVANRAHTLQGMIDAATIQKG